MENVGVTRGELWGARGFPPTEAHRRHCNALPKAGRTAHTRPRHAVTRTPGPPAATPHHRSTAARCEVQAATCHHQNTAYRAPTTATTLAPTLPWGQIWQPWPQRKGGKTGDAGGCHWYTAMYRIRQRQGGSKGVGADGDASRCPGLSPSDEGMSAIRIQRGWSQGRRWALGSRPRRRKEAATPDRR